jgi:hypothetical protein
MIFLYCLNYNGGYIPWEISTDQEAADSEAISTADLEKCIRLFVQNARKNAKYHSNLQKANLFSAENVTLKENQQDINLS